MSNPKVFEFAKEVGMTPLALMDKIREWHMPVKSHMAELEPDQIEIIRSKLSESMKSSDADKKTAVRKKAATPAGTAVAAAKKTPAKAASTVAAPKVQASGKAGAASKPTAKTAAKKVEEIPAAKTGATVVRRKKTDMMAAQAEAAEIEKAKAASEEAAQEVEAQVVQVAVKTLEVPEERVVIAAAAKPAVAQAVVPPTPAVEEPVEKKGPPRKKEVSIGASGVASEQTAPSAPKRNIIGRMDLSRVQAPAGSRSGQSQQNNSNSAQGRGGQATPGFASRSKGNIRAGFFQAPSPDLVGPAEGGDDYDRKREDKRRNKAPGEDPNAAAARDLSEAPPAFDAAEFRKREMVFQPKKKKKDMDRPALKTQITTAAAHKRVVKVFGSMKVADLAQAMAIKSPELIKVLIKNGVMANINTDLDFDTISLITPEFKFEAQNIQKTAEEVIVDTAFGDLDAAPITRPPVVAVMGHVDHGKTSLLDAIRSAKVAAGEAGGITQHIGAYQVTLDDGYVITFLDTPGHEAFTSMRARGANVTDIAIIVVAADDGVMPQTAEAINHAKAAKVPMIVVVNKMDKPGANPDRIKQQLTEYEVVPEEWGGTTIFSEVSAVKKTGIKELLEQIKLVAEVLELKANPKRSGTGAVIESRLEKGRGSVATILIQNGSVKVGQHIVAGTVMGRVRSMINDRGEKVDEALPGMPVEILGLDDVPMAGDKFDVVEDERSAEEASKIRRDIIDASKNSGKKMTLEEVFAKVQKGDVKELAVVLKADVAGSLEALQGMFAKLSTPEVKVRIIHSAIGGITETDVMLASTAKGIIIGFNVRPDTGAQAAAKRHGIEVRTYSIVYELIDEMKRAMTGLLTPDIVEKVMGRAEVRNTFSVPSVGTIAGSFVSDGKIARSNMARLIRDGKIIYEGKISSLKRFKDDAREVAQGFECGIGIENFNDVKVGDTIEAFIKEEVARELSSSGAEA